jgi:hypothetical protein
MNARGTVVGMAMWKTEGGDRANDNRLPPGCGFVFKDGKLKLNAEAPFSAATLRSTYKKINQRGDIFGHREERISEGAGADIRTVSFLGDHVFRDVPPFEVTTITETRCLLGYREAADGRESFIWDRSQFIAIDRLHGLRVPLKAVGMNAKLQVIGSFDQANRRGAGPGFLWENGRLRPLSGLIPSEYLFMQSIEPHTINAAGSITFTAELSMTQRKPAQPENFELTIREGDENLLERLRFD